MPLRLSLREHINHRKKGVCLPCSCRHSPVAYHLVCCRYPRFTVITFSRPSILISQDHAFHHPLLRLYLTYNVTFTHKSAAV